MTEVECSSVGFRRLLSRNMQSWKMVGLLEPSLPVIRGVSPEPKSHSKENLALLMALRGSPLN